MVAILCCAQITHYNTKQAGALLEVHIFADHLCRPETKAFIYLFSLFQ